MTSQRILLCQVLCFENNGKKKVQSILNSMELLCYTHQSTCGEGEMSGLPLMISSQGDKLVSLFGSRQHPGGLLIPVGLGDFFR